MEEFDEEGEVSVRKERPDGEQGSSGTRAKASASLAAASEAARDSRTGTKRGALLRPSLGLLLLLLLLLLRGERPPIAKLADGRLLVDTTEGRRLTRARSPGRFESPKVVGRRDDSN